MKTPTSEDDKKGNVVEQTSKESRDQASLENKEVLCTVASTSSAVIESEEIVEAQDNSAEKESDSRPNKKPARNKRRVATRLKNDAESSDVEKDKDENMEDHHLETSEEKDTSKHSSQSLESQPETQQVSRGRKAARKSRVKPSEQEPDGGEDTAAKAEEKKVEEGSQADSVSGNQKPRRGRRSLKEEVKEEPENTQEVKGKTRRSAGVKDEEPKNKAKEDTPEKSTRRPTRIRNNSKQDTTKPEEEEHEDVKKENDVGRKPTRAQKNLKEQQKPEETSEALETTSSEAQTSRRTRREREGEDTIVKEENTSKRTRRHSKEEETVKLEDQTKRARRGRKSSKEETKPEETAEESFVDNKEEAAGKKPTRKTRKNLKDDETSSVHEETKLTKDDSKTERASRTRAKTSDVSREDSEEASKEAEESREPSPQEETPKRAGGRGRRAAKKEDIPQVSTPVASRKRGQDTKAEVEEKRKKSDEGDSQESLGETITPRKRGRPRKVDVQNSQTKKEVSQPDPSPSRNTRQRPSSALGLPSEARTPQRSTRMSTSVSSATKPQSGSAPKIMFTGVVDTAGEETIRSLGGDIADSVFDCTHLVTDRVRRTVKFLCALARGIPIVTLDWIDKCKKSGCFLSPAGFLVKDTEQEKNFNFMLSESLQKAKKSPLFEGYEIHVTANVKPEPEQMKDIIRCCGATYLPKMPRSFKEKCVIVSCAEDAARCKSVPASVPITSAEFILSGILRQEVNPTAYLLNPADSGPTPAKRRR